MNKEIMQFAHNVLVTAASHANAVNDCMDAYEASNNQAEKTLLIARIAAHGVALADCFEALIGAGMLGLALEGAGEAKPENADTPVGTVAEWPVSLLD